MLASRRTIESIVASGEAVYGVTTGFGDLANRRIEPAEAAHLQRNLLVSHAVGVGPSFEAATVRSMLLRAPTPWRSATAAAALRSSSGCWNSWRAASIRWCPSTPSAIGLASSKTVTGSLRLEPYHSE